MAKSKTVKTKSTGELAARDLIGRMHLKLPKDMVIAVRVRCAQEGLGVSEAAREAFKGWLKG